MMKRIAEASPRFKARKAGALFLLGLFSAVFGEFFVRRLEIAADLIAVSSMIAVTLLLYGIFKPVSRGLYLLAASFNLVGLTFGALRWNRRGVDIPVVFDGFYCLVIGYLIFRSALLPRILGGIASATKSLAQQWSNCPSLPVYPTVRSSWSRSPRV